MKKISIGSQEYEFIEKFFILYKEEVLKADSILMALLLNRSTLQKLYKNEFGENALKKSIFPYINSDNSINTAIFDNEVNIFFQLTYSKHTYNEIRTWLKMKNKIRATLNEIEGSYQGKISEFFGIGKQLFFSFLLSAPLTAFITVQVMAQIPRTQPNVIVQMIYDYAPAILIAFMLGLLYWVYSAVGAPVRIKQSFNGQKMGAVLGYKFILFTEMIKNARGVSKKGKLQFQSLDLLGIYEQAVNTYLKTFFSKKELLNYNIFISGGEDSEDDNYRIPEVISEIKKDYFQLGRIQAENIKGLVDFFEDLKEALNDWDQQAQKELKKDMAILDAKSSDAIGYGLYIVMGSVVPFVF